MTPLCSFRRCVFRPLFVGRVWMFCISALHLSSFQVTGAASDVGDVAPFQVMAAGYADNRERFADFRCRFRVLKGRAATIEAAKLGKLTDVVIAHGEWILHNGVEKYELLCDERYVNLALKQEGIKTDSGGKIIVKCHSKSVLRADEMTLHYAPVIRTANLYYSDVPDEVGIRLTPFNPDVMGANEFSSPSRYLSSVSAGTLTGQYHGMEEVDGNRTLAASIGRKGEALRVRFNLDRDRGFLPVRFSIASRETGKTDFAMYILAAQKCSNGGWYPTSTLVVTYPDGAGPFSVRSVVVDKLEVPVLDNNVGLFLDLAANTAVSVPTKSEFLALRRNTRIQSTDLPDLLERCRAFAEQHHKKSVVSDSIPTTIRISIAATVIVLASLLLMRQLRRRSKGALR